MLGRAALIESADMLRPGAFFIGLAHVAIDKRIRRNGLATGLTRLAARMVMSVIALNMAAALVKALGEGPSAGLYIGIEGVGRRVSAGVNLRQGIGAQKSAQLGLGGLPIALRCFRHDVLR